LGWASEGLWSSAASAFELLAAGSGAGVIADRNRGLCCLWLADHQGAVAALRRYISRAGPTLDAVDLEALCQRIDRAAPRDQVEFVHLSWPIRNRDGLLAVLRGDRTFDEDSARSRLDPNDPKSPEVTAFLLLDRPQIEARTGLTRQDIRVVEGEIFVGRDTVILETYDDGRLDRLVDRFMATAGSNIPPAHPRTKIIAKEQRHLLTLSWRWRVPDGVPQEEVNRLNADQLAYVISTVWPDTPHPALRWRTPLQAAKAGDSETELRAAVRQLQETHEGSVDLAWDQLRAKLQLKAEPAIDPDRVEIDQLHLSRLALIPAELLDDDRVLALYHRAREWGIRPVANRVARLIDARASLMVKGKIEAPTLYGELAVDAAGRNERAEAMTWIARGRDSEPPRKRSAHSLAWEMIELQVQMMLDGPEVWVKSLAVILEHYRGNQEATSAVFLRLIKLGLVRVVADPNHPDQATLDTRILDDYLSRFGPRVTTAAGELGVAATRGEIWTPESGGGGGSLWTPGSALPPTSGEGKSKIIVPGQ
jgi:hypothetical protein